MKIIVGHEEYEYLVDGEPFIDNPERLIDKDDDLTRNSRWHKQGYIVQPLFDESIYKDFIKKILGLLTQKMKEIGIKLSPDQISQYHTKIEQYEQHIALVEKTKLIQNEELELFFKKLEDRVSEICGIPVQSVKPMNGERVFHFRIIRPNQKDFNPLHKDGWMDELKDCINLYIPICGSNEKSSLLLTESSHLLPEDHFVRTKGGATMNGIQFNVPGLISCKKKLQFET